MSARTRRRVRRFALAGLLVLGVVVVFAPATWLPAERFGAWGSGMQAFAAMVAVAVGIIAYFAQARQTRSALRATHRAHLQSGRALELSRQAIDQSALLAREEFNTNFLLHLHGYLTAPELMKARREIRARSVAVSGQLTPLSFDDDPEGIHYADQIAGSYDQAGLMLHLRGVDLDTRNMFLQSSWGSSIADQYDLLEGFLAERRVGDVTGRQFFAHFVWLAHEARLWHRGEPGVRLARVARILAGGQTGVDRAALNFARAHGVRYGGWCPRGGWAEDRSRPPGILADFPDLIETPTRDPSQRTEWNVRDSGATLILSAQTGVSPGTAETMELAQRFGRPCLELSRLDQADGVKLADFVAELPRGSALNVAGPRHSEDPAAESRAAEFLETHLTPLLDPRV